MKIVINTIINNKNYGNRLQNYALQVVLEQLGHDVLTIDRSSLLKRSTSKQRLFDYLRTGELVYKVLKVLKKNLKSAKVLFSRVNTVKNNSSLSASDDGNFSEFTEKRIHMLPQTETNVWNWINNNCDLVVIGSDQVWNYEFWDGAVIEFALPVQIRKISYAASIGVSRIPLELRRLYKKGLSSLSAITVREDSASNIVANLINQRPKVVLDPTLLLEKEKWCKIAEPVKLKSQAYLLTYFLSVPSQETLNKINAVSTAYKLDVVPIFKDGKVRYMPEQLIFLIENATFIMTDSFHISAFSIIFNKPFKVFKRNSPDLKSMNSRLLTLFSTLGIKNKGVQFNEIESYKKINQILAKKRAESNQVLASMIKYPRNN